VRRITRREHLLLLSAIAIAATTAFHHARFRPARARTSTLRAETARYAERLNEVKWPRPPEDPVRLAKRRDAARREVEAAREALTRVEAGFVSQCEPALADEVRLQVSAIADRHGVHVRENLPCPRQTLQSFVGETGKGVISPASDFVRFLTLGDPYALRVRQVTIEADFACLRAFLRELDELQHHVLVLRFDIEVDRDFAAGATILKTKLLLVL